MRGAISQMSEPVPIKSSDYGNIGSKGERNLSPH
jgi:hypothetical protein